MLFVYPAIFHREDNAYWVEFPGLLGCQTYGATVNEAMQFAQETLTGYLLTLFEGGGDLTAPSELSEMDKVEDGFATLVACDMSAYKDTKAVKKTLTIPAWLN